MPAPVQWAEAFCTAKRAEGLSRRTVDIYVGVLSVFTAWAALRDVAHVEALTPDDLRKFMVAVLAGTLAAVLILDVVGLSAALAWVLLLAPLTLSLLLPTA